MFDRAVIRRRYAAVAIRAATDRWRLHVVAVQRVPRRSPVTLPQSLRMCLGCVASRSAIVGCQRGKPSLHPLADAGNVAKGQLERRARHLVRMPDHVAVRLARLARHLGELTVGGEPDRAGDERADVIGNPFFETETELSADRWRSAGATRQVTSSIDLTASRGMTAEIFREQRVVRATVEVGRLRD